MSSIEERVRITGARVLRYNALIALLYDMYSINRSAEMLEK